MIPEQIGVSDVGLQHVHRLVQRHVPHLEHGGAAACCADQETGSQGMGAEIGRPDPLGVCLHDAADRLIGEPLRAEPAAFGDGAEQRALAGRPRIAIGKTLIGSNSPVGQARPGPRSRSSGAHQKFGRCQFKPALNWLMCCAFSMPNDAGKLTVPGRTVPLMATVRLPKSR
jgi:hypothetical protein